VVTLISSPYELVILHLSDERLFQTLYLPNLLGTRCGSRFYRFKHYDISIEHPKVNIINSLPKRNVDLLILDLACQMLTCSVFLVEEPQYIAIN